jgi:hypothetical protein
MNRNPWQKGLLILLALFFLFLAFVTDANPSNAQNNANLLYNGNFERGFTYRDGCGHVAIGWSCFTNRGQAVYGFYDDEWDPVVYSGQHSQLIEINTKGLGRGTDDRYAGIFQTVRLTPGAAYQIAFRGMIRSTTDESEELDPWRYRVQFGYSVGREADWRDVTTWVDVGWDAYDDRLEPRLFHFYNAKFIAQEALVTVYIRVWKKWGTVGEEIDINFDDVVLARTVADASLLPLLTPTPTQFISPLALPNGTPIISLPEPTPDPAIQRFVPPGLSAIAQWPRYSANHVVFAHPSPWEPIPSPLGGNAIVEEYILGIPGWGGEQFLGFSSVPFSELQPADVIATTPFMIGDKEGVKWLRQGVNYVGYQYCTSGFGGEGSFCVRVTTPIANAMVELQLDYLVRSIAFY